MEKLTKAVSAALGKAFPGCEAKLEVVRPAKRIGGVLVWEGFGGVEQIDRQRLVREALDAAIHGPDRKAISLILTLTPTELRVMKAG